MSLRYLKNIFLIKIIVLAIAVNYNFSIAHAQKNDVGINNQYNYIISNYPSNLVESVSALKTYLAGDFESAHEAAILAFKKKPGDLLANYVLAEVAFSKGDFVGALSNYKSIYIYKKNDDLDIKIANTLIRLGKFSEAEGYLLNKSVSYQADRTKTILKNEIYFRHKKYDIVIRELSEFLDKNKDFAAQFLLVKALYYKGNIEKAVKLFNTFPKEVSNSPDYWVFKSVIAADMLDFKSSYEYAKYAFTLQPQNISVIVAFTESLIRIQKIKEAKEVILNLDGSFLPIKNYLNSYVKLVSGEDLTTPEINSSSLYLNFTPRGNLMLGIFNAYADKLDNAINYFSQDLSISYDPLALQLLAFYDLKNKKIYANKILNYNESNDLIKEIKARYAIDYYSQNQDMVEFNNLLDFFKVIQDLNYKINLSPSLARVTGLGSNFAKAGILFDSYKFHNEVMAFKFANKDKNRASQYINHALSLNKDNLVTIFLVAYLSGNSDSAISLHKKILSKKANFIPSLDVLVDYYDKKKDLKEITRLYQNAYYYDRKNVDVISGFAKFLFKYGLNDQAIKYVEDGLVVDPTNIALKKMFENYYENSKVNSKNDYDNETLSRLKDIDNLLDTNSKSKDISFRGSSKENSFNYENLGFKHNVSDEKNDASASNQYSDFSNSYNNVKDEIKNFSSSGNSLLDNNTNSDGFQNSKISEYETNYAQNPVNSRNAYFAAKASYENGSYVKALKRIKVYFNLSDTNDELYKFAKEIEMKINEKVGL